MYFITSFSGKKCFKLSEFYKHLHKNAKKAKTVLTNKKLNKEHIIYNNPVSQI